MMGSRWAWLVVPLVAAACGKSAEPRPQWTVVIATDAPVPEFGDRLLIELLDAQGDALPDCSTCQRQLGADDAMRWPISFGIIDDRPELAIRVRVRLFRAALLGASGVPSSAALIDRTVLLPPTSSDLRVAVELPMRCFGVATDLAGKRSCDPDTGALASERETTSKDDGALLRVNTWSAAAPVPCPGTTPADMVCVPGGAFLLGDPSVIAPDALGGSTTPEHVVQLSPFRIDKNELTVKTFADLRAKHPELAEPEKKGASIEDGAFCTYGGSDPALPLNCVPRALAMAICAAEGKRLPSEAEWEYAAGNASSESAFPWGSDDDVCHYAVLARGDSNGTTLCRPSSQGTLAAGPAAGGSTLDLTTLGVQDLGGNLSEWVADAFVPYDGACFHGPSPLVDPTCQPPSGPFVAAARGGNWHDVPLRAHVALRMQLSSEEASPRVGVRCATSAK